MADQHTYDVTIDGETYTVASDTPLSDAQAYQYAKTQVPFDAKKQNEIMRANMAKQPPGTGEESTLASFAHAGPMANFGNAMDAANKGEGAKAVHQAVVGTGKVLAPAALPLLASPAGVAALALSVPASMAGDVGAREVAKQFTDNPDYQDVAGDVGGLAGGLVGGKVGSKYSGPVLRFGGSVLKNPEPLRVQAGKAVLNFADRANQEAAAKDAAMTAGEQIVADTKAKQQADAIKMNKALTPTKKPAPAKVSAADAEKARLAAAGVVPPADAAAANPRVAAPVATRTPFSRPLGSTADEMTDPKVLELRNSLRERAGLNNPNAQDFPQPAEDLTPRRPNTPTHPQTGAGGRGSETVPPSPPAAQSGEAAAPAEEMLTLEHRSGQSGLTTLDPEKHGTGQMGAEKARKAAFPEDYINRSYTNIAGGKVEPRFAGDKVYTTQVPKSSVYDFREDPLGLIEAAKAQVQTGQVGRVPSIAEKLAHDNGFTTVTFDGNTYQHTAPLPLEPLEPPPTGGSPVPTPPKLKFPNVPNGKNARPGASGLTLAEGEGGPNASGESAASKEALSRMEGMKARGEEFVVRKGNTIRKLVGPEAVDYTPQPGETFGVRGKDGVFRPLSEGEIKHALTGNRKAGSMPIAMRRALFNELQNRSRQ